MMCNPLEIGFESLPIKELSNPFSKQLATYLANNHPFSRLIECKCNSDRESELIIFEVDVEVSQLCVNEILPVEEVAIEFFMDTQKLPWVYAMREDFPRVPHTFSTPWEYPIMLCLFEEKFEEIRLRWTSKRLVEWIRDWLKKTASGTLHASNQVLEPIFLNEFGSIVLSDSMIKSSDEPSPIVLRNIGQKNGKQFLVENKESDPSSIECICIAFETPVTKHGIIHESPLNLADLDNVLSGFGFDVITALKSRITNWILDNSINNAPLVLVVVVPESRTDGGEIERRDNWVFLFEDMVKDIGVKLGMVAKQGDHYVPLLEAPTANAEAISLAPLRCLNEITYELSAFYNGFMPILDTMSAVGVGALGSQVIANLARSGFGNWYLIDDDILLPHNIARHDLWTAPVGISKARALKIAINHTFPNDNPVISYLQQDITLPSTEIRDALSNSKLILDMSASVSAGRFLGHDCQANCKMISVFLNPRGTDLVIIAEDSARSLTLDCLEMQYYREVLVNKSLNEHLTNSEATTRYAQSCRDVSSILPQDNFGLFAALASKRIKNIYGLNSPLIEVYSLKEDCSITTVKIHPVPSVKISIADWEVILDESIIDSMQSIRTSRLPVETGGVLLGHFDTSRQIIYLVQALPAPPDSIERPVYFSRGVKGLKDAVDKAKSVVSGMIEYVGEWHSHPIGTGVKMSNDDRIALTWQSEKMASEGLPGLMLIISDNSDIGAYVLEQTVI